MPRDELTPAVGAAIQRSHRFRWPVGRWVYCRARVFGQQSVVGVLGGAGPLLQKADRSKVSSDVRVEFELASRGASRVGDASEALGDAIERRLADWGPVSARRHPHLESF